MTSTGCALCAGTGAIIVRRIIAPGETTANREPCPRCNRPAMTSDPPGILPTT